MANSNLILVRRTFQRVCHGGPAVAYLVFVRCIAAMLENTSSITEAPKPRWVGVLLSPFDHIDWSSQP